MIKSAKNKEYMKEYRKTPQYRNYKFSYQKAYLEKKKLKRVKLRNEIIDEGGGKCKNCGYSDRRALQIDHVNGGGKKDREILTYKGIFEKVVLESIKNKENKYQILCANCNWIKRFENNE